MLTTMLGGRAFAERHGTGPVTVVALHGWGRSRADWGSTLQGYDALALDLPGFGAAPVPDAPWGTEDYADFVAEILAELDRPVLVAHSFGGKIAVRLAASRPALVRGVVLTGVPLLRTSSGSRPKPTYRLARTLHQRGLLGDDRMEALKRKHGSADYRAATGVMRDVLVRSVNDDYVADLEAIRANGERVAMVWGEHDTAAPVAMARDAHRMLGARATIEVVPGSAHLLDPALVTSIRSAVDGLLGEWR